ncbi:hypothetical protein ACXR2U_07585 [Jatrophihabitans sp. YIM 134969]
MEQPSSPSSVVQGVRSGVGQLVRGVRQRLSHVAPGADPGEWLAVTVLADRDTVLAGGLPAPLAELQDRIQVDVTPAPGDKGTEIAARVITDGDQAAGDLAELQTSLRLALRHSKQLLETGQVMKVDPQPHGARTNSPAGKALDEAQAHGAEQGVL